MKLFTNHSSWTKNKEFVSINYQSDSQIKDIIISIQNEQGINDIYKTNNILNIVFNPYVLSDEFLIKFMDKKGFKPFKKNGGKGFFANWLNSLAQNNKANFGSKRIDCCDINNNKK